MVNDILILRQQIHHEILRPTQQSQQVKGALICTAQHKNMVAHLLHQPLCGLHPDAQAGGLGRIGQFQIVDVAQILQKGMVLVHCGHGILTVDNLGTAGFRQRGIVNIDHTAVIAVFLLTESMGFRQ